MRLNQINTLAAVMAAIAVRDDTRAKVELTYEDKTLTSIRVGTLHISRGDYSGMKLAREVTLEEAKRYKLTATAPGFGERVEYFEEFSDALEKQNTYGHDVTELDTTQVDVLLDAAGKVVREGKLSDEVPAAGETGDDMPF